jgi:glyoxylase-like metal-dependent hydrolase (beta-lactamase superfamily II)
VKLSRFVAVCASATVLAACGRTEPADPPLQLEVYTASPNGYSVTSTLVYGQDELILIDPQFLLSEARQVVTMIRATGRTLTTIYTTHAHPDHFLGVAAIKEAFPEARYVALPEVAERMVTAWPARRNFWFETYGNDLPSEEAILPEPLDEPVLMLEGHELRITGELTGLDGGGNSFVHIPDIDAVVAGDIIFRSHLRPPDDTGPLYETLDMIRALEPGIVVAGHQAKDSPNDPAVLDFIPQYIDDFRRFAAESQSAEELEEKMREAYPGLAREDALETAAARVFEEGQ